MSGEFNVSAAGCLFKLSQTSIFILYIQLKPDRNLVLKRLSIVVLIIVLITCE